MPDLLNKQAIVNLLIDSPLREPIKINLIDIVNNTNEPDLPKVYSTITKELEIFQKATERRMKLADETIAKLGGVTGGESTSQASPSPVLPPTPTLPTPPVAASPVAPQPIPSPSLPVAPLDLPPIAEMPTLTPAQPVPPIAAPVVEPVAPTAAAPTVAPVAAEPAAPVTPPSFQPLGGAAATTTSDEDALAEIQKELDSLKTEAASDVAKAAAPAPAPQA